MSSRTSSGRIRVIKHQVVREQSIKWDVVGLFSAVIPLVGTVILYLLGWAYESNWYSYFGINIEQINIPVQQVLLHGLPAILYTIYFLSVSTALLFFFRALSIFIRNIGVNTKSLLKPMIRPFSRNEWGIILIISLLLMEFSTVFYFGFLFANFPLIIILMRLSQLLVDPNLIPSEVNYLGVGLAGIFLVIIFFSYIVIILGLNSSLRSIKLIVLRFLPKFMKDIRKQNIGIKKRVIHNGSPYELLLKGLGVLSNVNRWVWFFLFCFIYFLHMMSVSAKVV